MVSAMTFRRRTPVAPLWMLLILGGLGFGQASTATVNVTVVDPTDAVIADVEVVVEDVATSTLRRAITSGVGAAVFPALAPGVYHVTARREGFAPFELPSLVLNVGDQRSLRIELQAAGVTEAILVTEALPLINQGLGNATIVDRTFVDNQPLNGRTVQRLVGLSPGVVFTPANVVTQGQFSVNGQRASSNYFTVDGVSANFGLGPSQNLYEGGGGGVPALSVQGGTNSLVSVDAVQEFAIQTSAFAPEFGRQPGAQVSIATRSGTNELHGSLFNYFRNDQLDANNYFANANRLPKPALRQNDFGGVLGGPLYLGRFYDGRDRTFFFASYEGLRLRQPVVSAPMPVPSLEARENATGRVRDLLMAFPRPTGPADPNNPDQASFIGGWSNPSSLNATSVRVDHRFTDNFSAFGRLNHAPSDSRERAKFATASSVAHWPFQTQTSTLGWTWILSPRVVNDTRFNYSTSRAAQIYAQDDFGGAVVPPASSLYPSFVSAENASFYLGAAAGAELTDGMLSDNHQRQTQLVSIFAAASGRHALKFGVDYRRLAPVNRAGKFQSVFLMSNMSQLVAGIAPTALVIGLDEDLLPVYHNYSAFLQDAWQLNRRATLTYGLRYEVNPAPTASNGRLPAVVTRLDDLSNATLAPMGTRFYATTYGNVAPRLGLAYQLTDRGATLRAGVGVFYDLGYTSTGLAFSPGMYPLGRQSTFTQIALTAPELAVHPPAPSLDPPYPRVMAYEENYRLPYTLQYSLTLDQPVGSADIVSLTLVGAAGRRLGRLESLRNPTPDFTRIDVVRNNAISNYHALQAQYQRRMFHGLQALASYTWSKSLDTVSEESIVNFQAAAGHYDVRQDYGPSAFDVRHALSGAFSYDLPSPFPSGAGRAWLGGFSIDSSFGFRTATPVNVVTGRDPLGLGFTTVSRPDVIPEVPLHLEDPALPGGRRFNPAAFDADAPLAQQRQGTLGRNVLRGFPVSQVDVSLRRTFPLGEQARLLFRAEAFNVFNHPNFADPSGVLNNVNFGRATQMLNTGLAGMSSIYQTGGPRSIQLGLKLEF